MRKKYFVRLSKEERRYAQDVMEALDTAPRYGKSANVLLMTDESAPHSPDVLMSRVHCPLSTRLGRHIGSTCGELTDEWARIELLGRKVGREVRGNVFEPPNH